MHRLSMLAPRLVTSGTLVLAVAAGGCFGPRFDRGAMLDEIGMNVILPAHEGLLREAARLDSTVTRFAAEPSGESLLLVRERWLATDLAWRAIQLFQFDGLLIIHNSIERRPARADFIEEVIAARAAGTAGPIDADFIAGIGSTSKGLGAIEHLIFTGSTPVDEPASEDPDGTVVESFVREPARAEYLRAVAEALVRTAGELRSHWAPDGDNYVRTFRENDSDGADVQGSISHLANRMVELHEIATRDWLGRPTGRTTDGIARAEDVEVPLSGRSLELLIASVEGIQRTFEAGLDDYLDYLDPAEGEGRLSARIARQFDTALDALRAIDGPLKVAVLDDPATAEAAYDEMRELVVLLKSEMSAQLGITITFSDSDGD